MRRLNPILLLGVILDQGVQRRQRIIVVLLVEIQETRQVVPLFLGQLAVGLVHVNGDLNILECQIVLFQLIITLGQEDIGTGVGLVGELEPLHEGIDARLPLFLYKIQLRHSELGVDLHGQRDIWLGNHLPVIPQRAAVILRGVPQEGIQVVDIGQFIAVEGTLALSRDHFVEHPLGARVILGFCCGLGLSELLIHLVAQRGCATGLTLLLLGVTVALGMGGRHKPKRYGLVHHGARTQQGRGHPSCHQCLSQRHGSLRWNALLLKFVSELVLDTRNLDGFTINHPGLVLELGCRLHRRSLENTGGLAVDGLGIAN